MILRNLFGTDGGRYDTFHKGKYYIAFKRGHNDEAKKDITITIYRIFEMDSLRILLSDEDDPTFLCIINVARQDYEELKRQQGLLIDFDNFPAQLVRLLQQSAANNMFIILQQSNPMLYLLEIVEHNEFKKLVHLSLKTGPATETDIIKHMSETIVGLKKTISTLKSTNTSNEASLSDKIVTLERRLQDLTLSMAKAEEDKLRRETEFHESLRKERDKLNQERQEWQKNLDLANRTHTSNLQEALIKKDKQIDELNSRSRHLKDTVASLENQLSDKSQRTNLLEKEVQKSHIEVATLKAKLMSIERDLLEKEKHIHHVQSNSGDLDKAYKETSDKLKELTNSYQLLKREKTSLEERLSHSESLANKNNQAAQQTSEQLLKANQIISKQNSDLIEIKEKLLCRTAIALEQEKVIERSSRQIDEMKKRQDELKAENDNIRQELDILKKKYETTEQSLKDREETIKNNNMVIQWLHKKLEDNCQPSENKKGPVSSTPYFLSNRSSEDSSQNCSDDIPNFYATSRLSNVEDSPRTEVISKSGKPGLDPKYLAPATDDNHPRSKKAAKGKDAEAKGKENNQYTLPKVFCKEKKSGKTVSYRATPVSAYFP